MLAFDQMHLSYYICQIKFARVNGAYRTIYSGQHRQLPGVLVFVYANIIRFIMHTVCIEKSIAFQIEIKHNAVFY